MDVSKHINNNFTVFTNSLALRSASMKLCKLLQKCQSINLWKVEASHVNSWMNFFGSLPQFTPSHCQTQKCLSLTKLNRLHLNKTRNGIFVAIMFLNDCIAKVPNEPITFFCRADYKSLWVTVTIISSNYFMTC